MEMALKPYCVLEERIRDLLGGILIHRSGKPKIIGGTIR